MSNIHISEKNPLLPSIGFEIAERPIFDDARREIKGFKQIINNVTGQTLNISTTAYKPVKNERLEELAVKFCENTPFTLAGFAKYGEGEKVMAYLQNTNPKPVVGQEGRDWLVIGNSHDGSTAFFTGMVQRIFRCQNMYSERNQQNRLRHTMNIDNELRAIEETHDLYYNHLTGTYEMFERMAERKVNGKTEDDFLQYVLKLPADTPEEQLSGRTKNNIYRFRMALEVETRQLGENLWGLFNAATYYTTHLIEGKKQVFGNMFNLQADINGRAKEFCSNILKGNPAFNNVQERPTARLINRPHIEDIEPIEVFEPVGTPPKKRILEDW